MAQKRKAGTPRGSAGKNKKMMTTSPRPAIMKGKPQSKNKGSPPASEPDADGEGEAEYPIHHHVPEKHPPGQGQFPIHIRDSDDDNNSSSRNDNNSSRNNDNNSHNEDDSGNRIENSANDEVSIIDSGYNDNDSKSNKSIHDSEKGLDNALDPKRAKNNVNSKRANNRDHGNDQRDNARQADENQQGDQQRDNSNGRGSPETGA
ncbi:hypothetical protein KEM52_004299, partial [Ascosphaera acerosa]